LPEKFINGSQVVAKDKIDDHQNDGWTVLRKTFKKPAYPSLGKHQIQDKERH